MSKNLEKAYEPKRYEDAMYTAQEASGFFNPDVCVEKGMCASDAQPFTIVLPPPNVTGTLHMGHAVMLAIEDVMIRFHRMRGDRTLWVPGTDHAAIATQSKVEKLLFEQEGKTRHDLGREEFLQRVEAFAKQSHDRIVHQTKKMGASMDWSREAYTLDEPREKAVRTAFKQMYDEGLIYRGDRIVNWDPRMQSNVSDDEIERVEARTAFYYFKYGPFVIGTARPETKFGDKYVVMHPDDERYKEYKDGDTLEVEWINGPITATIIKDEAVDPVFGTGVMTITPWHDATDFGIAERHGLDKQQVIDFDGKLLPIAGEFAGMSIEEARPGIVEKLKSKGLLVKVDEEYMHAKATNYRGGGVIEPQIRKQWFIDVNKKFAAKTDKLAGIKKGRQVSLKECMQAVVREGQINIMPDRFEKTYFHWIDSLRDWCISRQIWYGHRIPVWYKDDDVYVDVEAPQGDGWEQDPDTLDTWFSSGLWTFSTLGWPENTDDLKTFHPTSVLETGYDILFFWVARMVLMSSYLVGDIPFETVYLHGLVRDEQGRKMSKSLDNILDPLDMVEKFGADATRLSLMIGSTPGNDTKLSEQKVESYRNFTNKLWNISRFMLLNIDEPVKEAKRPAPASLADEWILARLDEVTAASTKDLEAYNISAVGERLRDFTWGEVADWYLECAKVEGEKSAILNYIFNTVLKLWHPFMPFVTSAMWKEVYGDELLLVQKWPTPEEHGKAKNANTICSSFKDFQTVISGIRAVRTEYKIPHTHLFTVTIRTDNKKLFEENAHLVKALARVENLSVDPKAVKTKTSASFVVGDAEVFVELEGGVNVIKEKDRLQKELEKVEPYVKSLEKKLQGDFAKNAPHAVVEKEKGKLTEAREKLQKVKDQLQQLH